MVETTAADEPSPESTSEWLVSHADWKTLATSRIAVREKGVSRHDEV